MNTETINALDVTLTGEIKSKGVAYKDENETMEEFISKVSENEKIIGFEFNPVTKVLGIILG